MTQVYNTFFFGVKIDIPTIWGVKEHRLSENKISEMFYLYRRTGP